MKQHLAELQGGIDKSTLITGYFITFQSIIYKNKHTEDQARISKTKNKFDPIHNYRTPQWTKAEYSCFCSVIKPVIYTDHNLYQNIILKEFKRHQVIQSVFSDYMELKINNRNISGKSLNI